MPENYDLRPFAAGDLPRLQEIRAAAFRPVFESFRRLVGPDIAAVAFAAAEDEQARHLADLCAEREVIVAAAASGPIGFTAVLLDDGTGLGEIGLSAVDPAHQRRGVGAALFAAALDRMRARGMRAATVGTGGDESHAPARRAYATAGFTAAVPGVHLYRML